MIIGLGFDFVLTERIESLMKKYDTRFLNRIYTPSEVEFSAKRKNQAEIYASFWAVKEAVMKALGTGNRQGVYFREIEVCHHPGGKPYLKLYRKSQELATKLGADQIFVTMTHERGLAGAVVILEHSQ